MVYECVIFTNDNGITSEWISMDKYHVHFHEQFSTPSKGNRTGPNQLLMDFEADEYKTVSPCCGFQLQYRNISRHSSTYFLLFLSPAELIPNIAPLTFTVREELTPH